jgi:hypothetical protein
VRHQHGRALAREIADELAGIRVAHQGAHRHVHKQILTGAACAVATTPIATALGPEQPCMSKVGEGVERDPADHVNAAAVAAVAAVRPTTRYELLAPEA